MQPILIDFSLARVIPEKGEEISRSKNRRRCNSLPGMLSSPGFSGPAVPGRRLTTDVGVSLNILLLELFQTPTYIAPELFEESGVYDEQVDAWSLGVVLLEICTGQLIETSPELLDRFSETNKSKNKRAFKRIECLKGKFKKDKPVARVVHSLLQKKAAERMTCVEAARILSELKRRKGESGDARTDKQSNARELRGLDTANILPPSRPSSPQNRRRSGRRSVIGKEEKFKFPALKDMLGSAEDILNFTSPSVLAEAQSLFNTLELVNPATLKAALHYHRVWGVEISRFPRQTTISVVSTSASSTRGRNSLASSVSSSRPGSAPQSSIIPRLDWCIALAQKLFEPQPLDLFFMEDVVSGFSVREFRKHELEICSILEWCLLLKESSSDQLLLERKSKRKIINHPKTPISSENESSDELIHNKRSMPSSEGRNAKRPRKNFVHQLWANEEKNRIHRDKILPDDRRSLRFQSSPRLLKRSSSSDWTDSDHSSDETYQDD